MRVGLRLELGAVFKFKVDKIPQYWVYLDWKPRLPICINVLNKGHCHALIGQGGNATR